jgi:hypothetical protein
MRRLWCGEIKFLPWNAELESNTMTLKLLKLFHTLPREQAGEKILEARNLSKTKGSRIIVRDSYKLN